MAMTKPSAFTFLHANQVDALYTVYTATQIKTFFDSQATELRTYLYGTLTVEIDSNLATKAELAAAVLSGLSVDSITNAYLAPDVKIGSLADLDTTAKTSVTDAINELVPLKTSNAIKFYGKISQMSGGTGSNTNVSFTTEDYDDFSAINIPTSSTRITIPTGVTRVKFYAMGGMSYSAGTITLYKNGSPHQTLGGFSASSSTAASHLFYSTPITCVATNYFEINVADTAGVSVFGMEVLG